MIFKLRSMTLLLLALLFSTGFGSAAHGHALEPGYLELRQIDESLYAAGEFKDLSELSISDFFKDLAASERK